MKSNRDTLIKLPIGVLAIGSLVLGILTGWYRLGWELPIGTEYLHHGAIMTGSFVGTVILLERTISLKKKWLYIFPLINGLSLIFFLTNDIELAISSLIVGSVGLCVVFYFIIDLQDDLPHRVMWAGAGAWLIGNVLHLIYLNYAQSILWWMAFLLLTISGERLELTRFLPVTRTQKSLLASLLIGFLIACALPFHLAGGYLIGGLLVFVSIWLLKYDMIRKSVKRPGLNRYMALTLCCGYIWMGLTGVFYIIDGWVAVPYDVLVHCFFLGFVFSMIFAHAPIILPAVLKSPVKPFHPLLYLLISLFQGSLVVRMLADFQLFNSMRQIGGMLNGVLILLFLITLMILVRMEMGKLKTATNREKV